MSDYLHGAYGDSQANGNRIPVEAESAVVCIGTAPVHQIALGTGEHYAVDEPKLIHNIAEAKKVLGYSDDWASYSLCELMHYFFEVKGIGPLVMINVLDPEKHVGLSEVTESKTPSEGAFTLAGADKIDLDSIVVTGKTKDTDYTVTTNSTNNTVVITEKTEGSLGTAALDVTYSKNTGSSVSKTPSGNKITITNAENIILDSVVLKTAPQSGDPVVKVKNTDYTIAYNTAKKTIVITGLTNLGTDAMTVEYNTVNPAAVTSDDVIGSTDNLGTNTGIFAVKNVYQETGMIPAYMIAPGFSSVPAIHAAMFQNSQKVNGHWDMWMFTDLPILDGTTAITMSTAVTWKNANGYTHENETVYFPMIEGTDGNKYHLSTLATANFLELLSENEGIPFHSASNTDAPIIAKLWLGAGSVNKLFDDQIINENLNKNGIASAAFVGGRWAIWGAHSADYSENDATYVNVAETARMMLYYVSNDFQARRPRDVDQPLTRNGIDSIVAEEQNRLDALVAMGALSYGSAALSAESLENSDVYSGDFLFEFRVTTVPLAKSLKALVTWVDEGFTTYFSTEAEEA